MWLAKFFSRRGARDPFARLAVKVAQDTHEAVWSRVSHRVLAMRLNEARGYVRARAAQCIHAEVERALKRHPQLPQHVREDVISRATDHVVGLVIRDVLVTPAPAQKAAKRRAA